MTTKPRVDQFCAGFSLGDAISFEALVFQSFFRALGHESEIYCEQFAEKDASFVRHPRHYRPSADRILVYHHSIFTAVTDQLHAWPGRKILMYHNVTPPIYVEPYNRPFSHRLEKAQDALKELKDVFDVRLAASQFNAAELLRLGFREPISIVPVPPRTMDTQHLQFPHHLRYLDDGKKNILFVGRVFPNKRHQDLLKAFYFYRKIVPDARLVLAGAFHPAVRSYTAELHNLIRGLDLVEDVVFTGMLDETEMAAVYSKAHLFLSMSEHEGFLVPVVESMHYQVPILAFAAAAVPETLRESGVLFFEKDFPRIAAMMARMTEDSTFRKSILERQTAEIPRFGIRRTLESLAAALA